MPKKRVTKTDNPELLAELSFFDTHIGMRAHKDETGENYDTKIATERMNTTNRGICL